MPGSSSRVPLRSFDRKFEPGSGLEDIYQEREGGDLLRRPPRLEEEDNPVLRDAMKQIDIGSFLSPP